MKPSWKEWVILQLGGPVGLFFRTVVAAIIGVLVAGAYDWARVTLHEVVWIGHFVDLVLARIDPEYLIALSPQAIGGFVAVILWGTALDWVMVYIRAGGKQIQSSGNASPAAGSVKLDGLILPNGATVKQNKMVSYATLYPEDKDRTVRQPAPNLE